MGGTIIVMPALPDAFPFHGHQMEPFPDAFPFNGHHMPHMHGNSTHHSSFFSSETEMKNGKGFEKIISKEDNGPENIKLYDIINGKRSLHKDHPPKNEVNHLALGDKSKTSIAGDHKFGDIHAGAGSNLVLKLLI